MLMMNLSMNEGTVAVSKSNVKVLNSTGA